MFLGFWKTLSKGFFGFLNLPKGRPYSHVLEAGDARMIPSVVWLFDFYGPGSLKIKEPLVSILLWETILLSFFFFFFQFFEKKRESENSQFQLFHKHKKTGSFHERTRG
jgi:hypothetical protein